MKLFRGLLVWLAIVSVSAACLAQTTAKNSGAGAGSASTRYFQLTLDLKYPSTADGQPQPPDQSISTQVAVGNGRPGSCKTRMTSQLPLVMAGKTTYLDLGTKFDCNNVHVEGNGVAFSIVIETSNVRGMIKTKNHDGGETEEPIISQRNLALSVKLALDTPQVIFDSKAMDSSKLKKIGPSQTVGALQQEPGLQIVMTATELK
jgi:hypothetical protein